MKTINANTIRKQVIDAITAYFLEAGDDVGTIASNSINFPVVVDGEEGWVEVVVKVPKEDEGYEKREEYELKQKEKAQKELERQQKKEADAAKRTAKQKQKGGEQ